MTRDRDTAHTRVQLQRLAVAAGMTLLDGSPVVVGGAKCPHIRKIKAAIGFVSGRMSRDKFVAMKEDAGVARPYFAAQHDGGESVDSILQEWSGEVDCDGEMTVETYLQISG